jgi:predicted nucleotide-binding protein
LISEVLDAVLKKDQPVLVLLTPDDQSQLDPKLRKPGEPAHEKKLKGQARPNVLFEAGMAFGRSPDTTVLVEVGKIRPFSDVAGRHAVRLNNTTASRVDLATKLENAGCEVDRTADEEGWLTAGDFRI